MKPCVLGIDTSNYTTSLALVDGDLRLVANVKIPLPVKPGERGLRQSDAVFHHIKNLPMAFEMLQDYLKEYQIVGVGASQKPRNQEGSYMPCFLAGVNAATAISTVSNVPLTLYSHQCGHITAALYSADKLSLMENEVIAFHVSGGTTEVVKAHYTQDGYVTEVIGGSRDLHAGQAIDRIGVAMGLAFPCGAQLEQLASQFSGKLTRKSPKSEGGYIHLSGLENLALSLYEKGGSREEVAAFVFDYIGSGLGKMAQYFRDEHPNIPMVFGGGVMSSHLLQKRLKPLGNVYFAQPELSSDNACGIAVMTALKTF